MLSMLGRRKDTPQICTLLDCLSQALSFCSLSFCALSLLTASRSLWKCDPWDRAKVRTASPPSPSSRPESLSISISQNTVIHIANGNSPALLPRTPTSDIPTPRHPTSHITSIRFCSSAAIAAAIFRRRSSSSAAARRSSSVCMKLDSRRTGNCSQKY